jgi:hypothetical protein
MRIRELYTTHFTFENSTKSDVPDSVFLPVVTTVSFLLFPTLTAMHIGCMWCAWDDSVALKKPPDSLRSGSGANSLRCFGGSQVVQSSRIHPTSTHHTRRRSFWKRYCWLRFHLSLFVVVFAMFFSRSPGHYVCLAKGFDEGIRCFDDERVTILDDWNDYTNSGCLYFILKRKLVRSCNLCVALQYYTLHYSCVTRRMVFGSYFCYYMF